MKHIYKISGMTCNGCKNHVQEILESSQAIQSADIDLTKSTAQIETQEMVSFEKLTALFEGSSYMIHPIDEEIKPKAKQQKGVKGKYYCPMRCEGDKIYAVSGDCPVCGMDLVPMEHNEEAEQDAQNTLLKKLWIAVVFTLPIFIIAMSEMLPNNPLYKIMHLKYWNWLQFGLSIPVVFYATWMFFQRAYSSVKTMNLNMFTLVGIGAGVAWLFSLFGLLFPDLFPDQFKTNFGTVYVYFEAATVILTLVLLGQLLESRAHSKTSNAVKELLQLAPSRAIVIKNGTEVEVDIEAINVGDLLRIKPGSKIPVDGVIMEGKCTIDESMITGEPVPVDKKIDDYVTSGTINGNQSFVMQAKKVGSDTLLSQIIKMVNTASRSKAPIQKSVDKISGYFVPVVITISIITFITWNAVGPEPALTYAFINAIAVLIIACPCALGLATPMSIMVGVGKGAQEGVLIKSAESLEIMNQVDTLIIDKTGTVTEGRPSVEGVVSVAQYSENELLQLIASINQQSEHPLADATVRYAKAKNIAFLNINDFKSITGKGVQATMKGKSILVGNKRLMLEHAVALNDDVLEKSSTEQDKGKTVPFIAVDNKLVGFVVVADAIKKTSKLAIDALKQQGIKVIMMTGDNARTAKAVADKLKLNEVIADCLPQDKLNQVKKLQEQGKVVAMAGDGINDAPALALANVGIAMGTGTDVAIESAAITLVKGDLRGIVKARVLSKEVMRNIKQNLYFALAYNVVGIPIAAGVLYPAFGLLLSPMIAALAMSFSSVSVISNALRLKSQK